jgi:hypothetical protein
LTSPTRIAAAITAGIAKSIRLQFRTTLALADRDYKRRGNLRQKVANFAYTTFLERLIFDRPKEEFSRMRRGGTSKEDCR